MIVEFPKLFSPFILTLMLIVVGGPSNHACAQTPITLPDAAGQSMLIKNTLVAVNHGNLTGNYTVLRDLASQNFRQKNSAADLSMTFSNLRKQKLDLSPILIISPQLTQRPGEDRVRGRMQLIGLFATRPQEVQFALIFQSVNGGWMIDEISVAVTPAKPVVQTQHQAPATPRPRTTPVAARPTPPASRPAPTSRHPSTSPWKAAPRTPARR